RAEPGTGGREDVNARVTPPGHQEPEDGDTGAARDGLSATARRFGPMATKKAPAHRCTECGWTTVKWVGRCGECQAWGTIEEIGGATTRTTAAARVERPAVPIGEVEGDGARHRTTGVDEFDRVLGGGLVPGSVVLVAGEPGTGKSTLLLDAAARVGEGRRVLYISGEESAAQVRGRAERIGAITDGLYLASETDL